MPTEQGKDPFDIQEEVGDSNAPPLWFLRQGSQSVCGVCMICGKNLSLVFLAASKKRIGQMKRGVTLVLNITRGMFSGFKSQR